MFKKGHDGKFALGKPLGTRKGSRRHDASSDAILDRLHNDLNPSRSPVVRHNDCPSVNTEGPTLAETSAKGATDFSGGKNG
jgi:hypothetical protein